MGTSFNCKRSKKTFCYEENVLNINMGANYMHTFVKAHYTVHLKCVHFVVYKLDLNTVV